MSSPVLATKFYIPRTRTVGVPRPRLTEKLLAGVERPGSFGLISGPAGFGKTTLLSDFVEQVGRPVAWVSLDEGDNDPVRFWTCLIQAFQSIQNGAGKGASALFQSRQPFPDEAVPSILINDLAALAGKIVLILDDYHAIRNPSIHTAFSFLLDHLPDPLNILVSTRVDPPWPLARFRARNQLIELRAADLRFRTEEAAAFLNQVMGLNLSPEDVAGLEARTEGWIAGLQLAALSMKGRSDTAGFLKAFTGSHVYVAEYLLEEVLQRQPEAVQAFLLQTSILERLSASLCDAVTERGDGQAALLNLQRSNLFILPLDEEGRWFRYHHLFADLLQARLQQTFAHDAINGLHERAAAWFAQNEFAVEAIHHAMAARDFDLAARLVEQNTYPLVTRGELATLTGWIQALPPEANLRPQFLLAKAWALLFAGDAPQMEALLAQIDAQIELEHADLFEAGLLKGSAAAIRAFFTLMAGDHAHALELAEQAEKFLPPARSHANQSNPFLSTAHSILPYTLGTAYRGQGELEKAAQAFEQQLKMFAAPEDILGWAIAMIEVAVIRRMQGRLHDSEDICRRAMKRIADQGADLFGSLARVDAALSEVLREHNDLDEAGQRVRSALERMQTWNMPTDRLAVLLTLMRLQLCQGDLSAARETARLAKDLRAGHPVFWDLSRSLDILEIRLALQDQNIPEASRLMEALEPGTGRITFLREQELVLLARLRLAQGRPDDALAVLGPPAGEAEAAGRLYAWLEILVQQALALEAGGGREAALEVLMQALAFARTEGFVRVFVDEGEAMHKLLLAASARPPHSGADTAYLVELLRAFPAGPKSEAIPPSPGRVEHLVEPLTPRELEVLQLIAMGDSNRTIADKLVITVSAVKKHTGNIYSKFNVTSRTQALARASQLGLLSAGR